MSNTKTLMETLITGDGAKLVEQVKSALDSDMAPGDILSNALIPGMDVVGDRMEKGDMFIPEVLMAAQAMGQAVAIIKPLLGEGESSSAGKVVVGTVKGDLHDIGKNLVAMMMESAGFDVVDLGVDIAPEAFIQAIEDEKADIVGLSALLTTTMPAMKETVDGIKEKGLRDSVKIIIGGAPVNQVFADEIGADAYAPDAGAASKMAKNMLKVA